ncbi:MAG: hemolysin family protein [Candidatus Nanopelagicus sp.]|nr:HlyC/CorC family transporter [Actinomycetota bacterium]
MAEGALISIAIVLGLIALGGIFVAAEIALISLRESQVKQIAGKGKRGNRVAKLTGNPNRFLAAVQVGITLCGFLSAALGAEQLGVYVIPRLESLGLSAASSEIISIIAITLVIVYISLVFGELVPKRLALYKTESIALATASVVDRVAIVFRPIIWLLSQSTDLIVKLFGITSKSERNQISDVELMELVSGHADLTKEEREIVEEVFNTSDRLIHEVMVPRTEVDFLDASLSISAARKLAVEHGHSRYPVVRGSSDEVIGFLHVRDLLNPKLDDAQLTIMEIVRNVIFLPGTKGVLPALTEMRGKRQHIAIVLDEYGGTDGIVTLENLVECLIGEIQDEYDSHETQTNLQQRSGEIEIDGLISLEDLQDQTGIELPEGPYETVSGFVMHKLGRIAQINDVVKVDGGRFTIISMNGKRVGQLLLARNDVKK